MTKKDDDILARQIYLEARTLMPSDMIDVIAKRKIFPDKIKSDMALFRKKDIKKNITLTYYYNRIELRVGNQLDILPFNVSLGK